MSRVNFSLFLILNKLQLFSDGKKQQNIRDGNKWCYIMEQVCVLHTLSHRAQLRHSPRIVYIYIHIFVEPIYIVRNSFNAHLFLAQ